jgi:transposase
MPAPGRPLKLTPEIIEDVRRLLPTAMNIETVAAYLGICSQTWRNWLRQGSTEEKRLRRKSAKPKAAAALHLEFFWVHKKALAEGEIYAAGIIKKAAIEQWQAAAWFLERIAPQRWGRDTHAIAELKVTIADQGRQLSDLRAQLPPSEASPPPASARRPGRQPPAPSTEAPTPG